MTRSLAPESLVARFADSIGRPREVQIYLEQWQSESPASFALIDARAIRLDADIATLMSDIHYLAAVGLYPVVVNLAAAALNQMQRDEVPAEQVESPQAAAAMASKQRVAVAGECDVPSWLDVLGSRKVILLGPASLRRQDGSPLSLINMTTERALLAQTGALALGHDGFFARAAALLDGASHSLTVGVTSAANLMRELFTVRGSGTLFRVGSSIASINLDIEQTQRRLTALLESAFGRRIMPRFFERSFACSLVADDFRGAAIVEPGPHAAAYLSKFAVSETARGEGVGRDLWSALLERAPSFYWRARRSNPIEAWYGQNADGLSREGEWTVFWRGLTRDAITAAIEDALGRPDDFDGSDDSDGSDGSDNFDGSHDRR